MRCGRAFGIPPVFTLPPFSGFLFKIPFAEAQCGRAAGERHGRQAHLGADRRWVCPTLLPTVRHQPNTAESPLHRRLLLILGGGTVSGKGSHNAEAHESAVHENSAQHHSTRPPAYARQLHPQYGRGSAQGG